MRKAHIVSLVILIGGLIGFGFITYKLQSHITPKKQIAITISHGVRNPGTKFFDYGVNWQKVFQEFDVIRGYDISKYNLDLTVKNDQQVELKPSGFLTKIEKISLKNAEKLKISREIVEKIRDFLKENKNKKLTWKELEWKLEVDFETLKKLQENFTLD